MTKTEKCEQIRQTAMSAKHVNITNWLSDITDDCSHIAVYGAGNAGGLFHKIFSKYGATSAAIDCYLDKQATTGMTRFETPVYKADDPKLTADYRKNVFVVIAIWLDEAKNSELVASLKALGYTRFINMFSKLGCAALMLEDLTSRNLIVEEVDNIVSAFELMGDEHSEDVFMTVFKAHATLQYDFDALSVGMPQYVDVNVPFRHQYHSFVDCGAFNGDTLEALTKRHRVERYIGFEPDLDSYAKLSIMADNLSDKFNSALLLPLAVSDKNEFLKFDAYGSENSKIDPDGTSVIQTVRLDDMLKGYDNLLIKMDIEGAEIAALHGAKNLIINTAPDLAICVYHKVSDLWRIPLLLKKWVPSYKFWLRNHVQNTLDTILYATREK